MRRSAKPPSLQSLRAFALAARHQSLRAAATELGVTPSAVSHQVRTLETRIGGALFERGARHVRLTARGAVLGKSLADAFGRIDAALDRACRRSRTGTLKIAALPLFASAWMAPRLSRFEVDHPELSLVISTESRLYDLHAREADVAIRNLDAPSPGLHARKLLDLRATPLCAAALAQRLSRPADLATATLIALNAGRAGWADWLARAGVPGLRPRRTLTVDSMPEAIDAAARGRGVMLGLLPLIWDVPAAGALVAPFGVPPQEAGAYFVVCRREDRADATIRSFLDWLVAEMRGDGRRLMRLERARLAQPGQ